MNESDPKTWPAVHVLDPSLARGLFSIWAVCSPKDTWYVVHASHTTHASFSQMVNDLKREEMRNVPRPPSLRIMDCRGGAHSVNLETRDDFFTAFRRQGLIFVPSKSEEIRVNHLHEWLTPRFDPLTGRMTAKLYFTRNVHAMKEGPCWALERFVWNPDDPTTKQRQQTGKDWVDCLRYLALHPGLSWAILASDMKTGETSQPKPLAQSFARQSERGVAGLGSMRGRGLSATRAPRGYY